jgi:hypothetical protein
MVVPIAAESCHADSSLTYLASSSKMYRNSNCFSTLPTRHALGGRNGHHIGTQRSKPRVQVKSWTLDGFLDDPVSLSRSAARFLRFGSGFRVPDLWCARPYDMCS